MWICLLMTCTGFLSGSVMYSYILPKWIRKIDIRTENEDGNPGGANAITTLGPAIGCTCLALDILKAFVPVYISVAWLAIIDRRLIPIMMAPVLGHAFTPLLRFKGGKAVATSFGSLLGVLTISWAAIVYALAMIFFKFIIILSPDSFKIMVGFILSSLFLLYFEPITAVRVASLFICLVVCYRHFLNPNKGKLSIKTGPFVFYIAQGEDKPARKH